MGFDGVTNLGLQVVLIHGFLGSSAYYKWLAEHIVTKHQRRVLRYDNYGIIGVYKSMGFPDFDLFECLTCSAT